MLNLPKQEFVMGRHFQQVYTTDGYVVTVDNDDFAKVITKHWIVHRGYAMSARLYMHHFVLNLNSANLFGRHVHHKDGNTLNNCRSNLELLCPTTHSMTRRKRTGTSSQYKGVSLSSGGTRGIPGKWIAQISFNGCRKHLGTFQTELEAALAYDDAARKLGISSVYLNIQNEHSCPVFTS